MKAKRKPTKSVPIQVIAQDQDDALAIEQALLDKVMRELGMFLAEEEAPRKRSKGRGTK